MKKNNSFNILIVDDEIEYQKVISLILEEEGYNTFTSSSAQDAMEKISDLEIDLVITDLKMPKVSGLTLLQWIMENYPTIPVIVATGFGSIESAVETMKKGAKGYFVKGQNPESLIIDINRIFEIHKLKKSNTILKKQIPAPEFFLNSKNPEMQSILNICKKIAKSNINVLILGESGVGKEVIAQYIHKISNRKDELFIPVNCAVFSDGTIESELFGHEKGAFTGAHEKRIGRFEEANNGTLFLDEVGEITPEVQVKLLRVFETQKIERVGSNKSINLDIRLIAATNSNMKNAIETGDFRKDLWYRINALTITIPPLRDRKEDIESFIYFFLNKIEKDQKKSITKIEDSLKEVLLTYDYPGNLRELKNIIERLVVLSEDGILRKEDLNFKIPVTLDPDKPSDISSLKEARAHFEADYITHILKYTQGNVSESAKILEITSRQLWNKISEYRLKDLISDLKI